MTGIGTKAGVHRKPAMAPAAPSSRADVFLKAKRREAIRNKEQRLMRWFWTAAIILVLFALDRAYMDGQNAALMMSGARRAAHVINDWASELTRKIRP